MHDATKLLRSPRYPMHAEIDIKNGDAIIPSEVVDISREGMLVSTPEKLSVGQRFHAWLRLVKPIKVLCVVARLAEHHRVGIRYVTF